MKKVQNYPDWKRYAISITETFVSAALGFIFINIEMLQTDFTKATVLSLLTGAAIAGIKGAIKVLREELPELYGKEE